VETPENGRKRRNIAEYDLRSLDNVGIGAEMLGGRLMAVSLVREPLNPACRVISVSTPSGPTTFYDHLREGQDQEC
jgi:hypothetical protein